MAHKGKQDVAVTTHPRRTLPAVPGRIMRPLEDFDQAFDRFMSGDWMRPIPWGTLPWEDLLGGPVGMRVPGVDVIDRDDHVLVRAEMPGVDKKDVDVSISDSVLTIKGSVKREEKEERGDYYRREITQGSFCRRVGLPASVDGSKISAKLQDGVLEVTVPKKEGSGRHTIKVQ